MNTFLKMTNITVATTEATMVNSAIMKVSMAMGKARKRINVGRRCGCKVLLMSSSEEMDCGGRFDVAKGTMKMAMKLRTVAEIKRPNIQCDATRAILRASVISVGRATKLLVSGLKDI